MMVVVGGISGANTSTTVNLILIVFGNYTQPCKPNYCVSKRKKKIKQKLNKIGHHDDFRLYYLCIYNHTYFGNLFYFSFKNLFKASHHIIAALHSEGVGERERERERGRGIIRR